VMNEDAQKRYHELRQLCSCTVGVGVGVWVCVCGCARASKQNKKMQQNPTLAIFHFPFFSHFILLHSIGLI